MIIKLAWRSIWYRRIAVSITIAAISISVFTLFCVEHLRYTTKQSFDSTVSGVDLIVGPRTGDINLLLTTVFRIGHPSQNLSWQSYSRILEHPKVKWGIPISLGDSHRGFRVVGTEDQFFSHYKYSQAKQLTFSSGKKFIDKYDVVLGSSVAYKFGYRVDQELIIDHGVGKTSFHQHDSYPFRVSGILKPTGTPIDNALYVSLEGLDAVHHAPAPLFMAAKPLSFSPKNISAAMVGLTSKLATLNVQREINHSKDEPLTAILPGVALSQLWQISRGVESALNLMANLIFLSSLLGLGAVMLSTMRERTYEFSVLRTLGAGAIKVFFLIQAEAILITLLGVLFGVGLFLLAVTSFANLAAAEYGIDIGLKVLSVLHMKVLGYIFMGSCLIGTFTAFTAVYLNRRT